MLEPRPKRAVDIMILPHEPILAIVIERIQLVAPVAREVEPFYRGGRGMVGGEEGVGRGRVGVGVGVEGRVPEGPTVSNIVKEAEGKDIRVGPRGGVHSVRADGRVHDRSRTDLFDGVVGVRGPEGVFAEEDEFGVAVVEADEGVFPVADVVAPADVEDDVAEIVAVEVEPEGVENAVAFVDGDEHGWGGAVSALGSFSGFAWVGSSSRAATLHFALVVFVLLGYVLLAAEPVGSILHVVVTGQENMASFLVLIELVKICQIRILQFPLYRSVIEFWCDVEQMLSYIARPKLLFREQMNERCVVKDVLWNLAQYS